MAVSEIRWRAMLGAFAPAPAPSAARRAWTLAGPALFGATPASTTLCIRFGHPTAFDALTARDGAGRPFRRRQERDRGEPVVRMARRERRSRSSLDVVKPYFRSRLLRERCRRGITLVVPGRPFYATCRSSCRKCGAPWAARWRVTARGRRCRRGRCRGARARSIPGSTTRRRRRHLRRQRQPPFAESPEAVASMLRTSSACRSSG